MGSSAEFRIQIRCSSNMRQRRTNTTLLSIPIELIVDILLRLPVESLIRCRCVCKSLRSLIFDRRFVMTHLNNIVTGINMNTNSFRLLVSHNDSLLLMYCEGSKDGDGSHLAIKEVDHPAVMDTDVCLCILGSCNGLVCLEIGDDNSIIILWNPCTRDTKVLPQPPYHFQDKMFHGFGYDSLTEDYKIMLATEGPSEVMMNVFSLKRNSWRTYEYLADLRTTDQQGCFLNGALHWITFEGVTSARNCLYVYNDPTEDTDFCIWIMKEYGVKESWTRVIKISSEILAQQVFVEVDKLELKVVCILENGEVLMDHEGKVLVSYNPKTRTFRNIIKGKEDDEFQATTYLETLVSPVTAAEGGGGANNM
ncbi:hypothetical protein Pyn_07888 [Prunus yedoensis var. nudiflora]|uniref:F-box domain-containing protein n=1 Tax=Prunus yedoensis var. nudiflora TaxID=2094558 RepID=A0A314XH93_PRUYE|nr:hypothetical protein Pyn_07888 [Prunus yedoensis var. nudiflora]